MRQCPKIVAFKAVDPAFGWIACYYVVTKRLGKDGTVWEKLPTLFTGRTEAQVVEMAEQWWEDQQQKEMQPRPPPPGRRKKEG